MIPVSKIGLIEELASMSRSGRKECCLRGWQVGAIVGRSKKMTITIECHDNTSMTQASLNRLGWKFQAAIALPVDAPTCIEVSQGMHAVFRLAFAVDNPSGNLGRI